VRSSAKADSAIPASNAIELTPQISEFLFKLTPHHANFAWFSGRLRRQYPQRAT
jgi:hypothetical protein